MTAITARAQSEERNQRAVFAALARMTKDRTLLLECWEFFASKFRGTPVLAVNDFVVGLANHVGLDSNQKRAMTVALFAALNRDVAELPELPATLRDMKADRPSDAERATAAAEQDGSSAFSPSQTVFQALLGDFCYRLARQDPDAATDLAEIVAESSLPTTLDVMTYAKFGKWADGGFDIAACPIDVPEEHLADIVHQFYVGACEAVGPMAVDRLLTRAVENASKLAEADLFPPDRLL
ncbi:MAG: hypothetical protein AB8B96_01055 [Lysobacterales bacterium]